MSLAALYLLVASICTHVVADGGAGWLDLPVLLLVWNAFKLLIMGPVSLVLLLRIRDRTVVASCQTEAIDIEADM